MRADGSDGGTVLTNSNQHVEPHRRTQHELERLKVHPELIEAWHLTARVEHDARRVTLHRAEHVPDVVAVEAQPVRGARNAVRE